MKFSLFILCLLKLTLANGQVFNSKSPLVHTFSIVARDAPSGEIGVGVQSHWFSVGTAVPWAAAGVGVVATQSFVDKSYGTKGLQLLQQGYTAQQALDSLVKADAGRDVRQVAIIDNQGGVATHTGNKCIQYASHIIGDGVSVQSNMMLGNTVCEAMMQAYKASANKPLAERILVAMDAAQKAGGDIRGMQAAALVVVKGKNDKPWNDKVVDLRVDDHVQPLKELRRLYNVHLAYEYMNAGDLFVEKNEMEKAMAAYREAMKMFPGNDEMKYWTAITLANNKQVDKAIPMLQSIYKKNSNWRLLTTRLKPAGLLTLPAADLEKILKL